MINLILGSGISGLGAAYKLKHSGREAIVLEKNQTYGGLCDNFEIDGFRFDRFVHFSFSNNPLVNEIFKKGAPEVYRHVPLSYNLYHGVWVKHPAQINLYPLTQDEKNKIIADFKLRPEGNCAEIRNYEDWLRAQFGNYFAEHFPMVFTRKYWMTEASALETRWIGPRIYKPSIDEVIRGANASNSSVTYYSKEMRYPTKGGFKSYLSSLADGANIRYGKQVVHINSTARTVTTADGDVYVYDRLISSLPLPEVIKMLDNVPEIVLDAASKLRCTHGYLLSVALRMPSIPPYLWWYIYDEDILPARVYSPSMKSPDNAPTGCSSIQLEIYCDKDAYTQEELVEKSLGRLIEQGIINADDVLWTDLRYEPYANVIFDHAVYSSRQTVRDYLTSIGIETIGRYGEWDYLWTDQALISGLSVQ